jgi:hypothetical protein
MSVQIKDLLLSDGMAEQMVGSKSICVEGREITNIKDLGPDSAEFWVIGELDQHGVLELMSKMFGHWVDPDEFIESLDYITSEYSHLRETYVRLKRVPTVAKMKY